MIPVLARPTRQHRNIAAAGGAGSYASLILADSPVAYWRLGESSGTSAADATGNGHTGTYVNGPTLGVTGTIFGDADTAVLFDGVDDVVTVPHSAALAQSAATYECWVNTTNTGKILLQKYGNGTFHGYALRVGSTGKLGMLVGDLAGGWFDGTASINDGNWHHCVGTYAAGTVSLYVDGASAGTASRTANLTDAAALWFAKDAGGVTTAMSLDEVAVYGAALSSTQVTNHYNRGKFGT